MTTSMVKRPRKLRKEPIVQVVAELRFAAADASRSAILPGLIYSSFAGEFPTAEALPPSQLPSALRGSDASLATAAFQRFVGKDRELLFSDRGVQISVTHVYPGWESFSKVVAEVFLAVLNSKISGPLERVSLKYVNFTEASSGSDILAATKVSLNLGGRPVTTEPTMLRAELKNRDLVAIVTIVTSAQTVVATEPKFGFVVDVDVVAPLNTDSNIDHILARLNEAHEYEKDVFFSLLSEDVLRSYEPDY